MKKTLQPEEVISASDLMDFLDELGIPRKEWSKFQHRKLVVAGKIPENHKSRKKPHQRTHVVYQVFRHKPH